MSKTATAHFVCDAQSSYAPPSDWVTCNNHITVDLVNDGQYDGFNTPDGWHIALGTEPERTIVRCPSHCRWVPDEPQEAKGFRGHWEDAPPARKR